MCGIAGLYRLSGPPSEAERAADLALTARMLTTLVHRGPDDDGMESVGRVTLGARRLSILDPAGGHQPLADASGRVWAVQNGEIYNFPELRRELASRHSLRTHTDTELLPALWRERGSAMVDGLRGMFAFAVFDADTETLLLARDPIGVKPLYIAEQGGRLRFASELKALLADPDLPRELDPAALAQYLALGYVPGERTVVASIRKLRPGCLMLVTPQGASTERYWPWPDFGRPRKDWTVETATIEAKRLLSDSAEAMLLSDVPVGLLLSGGLDSSVLAALLPEARRRELHTFSIGFPGAGRHDERPFARRVADSIGTRHHDEAMTLDVATELPRVVRFLDEPCADPAALPAYLIARAAAGEVKVLLSGTGGDEVFGGYRRYQLGAMLRKLAWLPRSLASVAAGLLAETRQHRGTDAAERMVWLRKLLIARSRGDFFSAYHSVFEAAEPRLLRDALENASGDRWRERVDPAAVCAELRTIVSNECGTWPASDMSTALTSDFLFYLPDDLLLKENRCSMGASVEGRVPYLDPALVRFSATLPDELRFGPEGSKRLLRRIGSEILPAEIATRPKHGFSVPVEEWLRGPLDELVGDVAAGSGSGLFDRGMLRAWHARHRAGRDRSGALWRVLVFELWWREVGAAPAVPLP